MKEEKVVENENKRMTGRSETKPTIRTSPKGKKSR